MKLMIATNIFYGKKILNREFDDLVWASDNMETVAHYYEGCVIEIDVALKRKVHIGYVSCNDDLNLYGVTLESYTYGMKNGMTHPANAKWYSFSKKYLEENLKSVKEIFPDLSPWNEVEEEEENLHDNFCGEES